MKLEFLQLNVGKKSILGISILTTTLVLFNACKKEDLRANQNKNLDAVINVAPQPSDTLPCGGFRTQTQGGWGAPPHGNNPGKYMQSHFAGAFPNGLTVGCTYKITLNSAQAITDYLPGGGKPAALTSNYTNPTGLKNNLASQLVTLTLSVQFDRFDPNFSSSSVALGDLVIASGPFKGKKISDVLTEANNVLGGCPSAYSATDISDVLTSINENFDDGTKNGGFLLCPDKIVVVEN